MPHTGPQSKLDQVERTIIKMLLTSKSLVNGLGFREIYKNLQKETDTNKKAGSFTTVNKCLHRLKDNHVIYQSSLSKKYFFDYWTMAYYHRDIVMESIAAANVLGGGELLHPKSIPLVIEGKVTFPRGTPRICVATNTFIQANLKGLSGFVDEGIQYIWTQPVWPEKKRKDFDQTRKTPERFKDPLHFEKIVTRRLNPARTAREWVKTIWTYAQENKLVSKDLTLQNASNDEIEKIWREIFTTPKVKTIILTEFIDPEMLLEWLKTSKENKQLDPDGKTDVE